MSSCRLGCLAESGVEHNLESVAGRQTGLLSMKFQRMAPARGDLGQRLENLRSIQYPNSESNDLLENDRILPCNSTSCCHFTLTKNPWIHCRYAIWSYDLDDGQWRRASPDLPNFRDKTLKTFTRGEVMLKLKMLDAVSMDVEKWAKPWTLNFQSGVSLVWEHRLRTMSRSLWL